MEKDQLFAQRLMQNLYRIARCRHAMFQDILTDYGVTLHQFHLLLHLKSKKQVKVTDLSDKMMVSMPTASRMINTLCDMGMISKKKSQTDRRSTYLQLTGKGKKVVGEIREKQLEKISMMLKKVSDDDKEAFLNLTERIADKWAALVKEDTEET